MAPLLLAFAAWLFLWVGAACAGAPARPPVVAPLVPLPEPAPAVAVTTAPPPADASLLPSMLLPAGDAVDAEVARIGDLVLRQSHAYARILVANPKLALSAVDLLVFDVLVAHHAEQFGIRVGRERVDELAAAEERRFRSQVQQELGGTLDFQGWLWRVYGQREADWRQTLRVRTAQRLYQGYVIRYLAAREDRVAVRFLVHKDEKVAAEVVAKVRAGADFATLALRHSEDPSRSDGGLLPAFGRDFEHPVAAVAFGLQKGEVSAPFRARFGDGERWFTVFCVDRMPGRDLPFADLFAEVDRDLEAQPLTNLEITAYTLRWRQQVAPSVPVEAANR
jgi:parvulin-like peptidyl-prolyl isomerase